MRGEPEEVTRLAEAPRGGNPTIFRSPRTVLRFDRLDTGELVAIHSHEGRTVAAIVHPLHQAEAARWVCNWSLAGNLRGRRSHRPKGQQESRNGACAHAAEALGIELGITIDGYEVAP